MSCAKSLQFEEGRECLLISMIKFVEEGLS